MSPSDLILLCIEAATSICGERPPTREYARRTAMLLTGTAMQESNSLRYRRQTVFDWSKDRGGWGLWQTEGAVLTDTHRFLSARPVLLANSTLFVFQDEKADPRWFLYQYQDVPTLLRLLSGFDRWAVAQCRLHYFQKPGAIPESVAGQADYWKRWYNTPDGAGTPAQYQQAWAPVSRLFDALWQAA